MMDKETSMTAEEAKSKGFIDTIIEPAKAMAFVGHDTIVKMNIEKSTKMTDKEKELNGFMDKFLAKAKKIGKELGFEFDPVDIVVELNDGEKLFVVSEDGELEGKEVFKADAEGNRTDEAAPDGTHDLNDGRS